MAFIKESVIKKYSVLLPYIGGTVSLLALVLQAALDNQTIPLEYHLIIILCIRSLLPLATKIG
jgi:hypothetical protein